MMPLAPPLFSTTTGCEIERPSWSAVKRASVSVTPPGGQGTIIFIGLSGYSASTGRTSATSAAAIASRPSRRTFIVPPVMTMGKMLAEVIGEAAPHDDLHVAVVERAQQHHRVGEAR